MGRRVRGQHPSGADVSTQRGRATTMSKQKKHRADSTPFPDGGLYEIVKVAPRRSVIIVGSDTPLTRIPWLKLVEIAPGRNLITLPPGTSIESLEVALLGLMEKVSPRATKEWALLKELGKYIGRLRRQSKMSKVEILIVDAED